MAHQRPPRARPAKRGQDGEEEQVPDVPLQRLGREIPRTHGPSVGAKGEEPDAIPFPGGEIGGRKVAHERHLLRSEHPRSRGNVGNDGDVARFGGTHDMTHR